MSLRQTKHRPRLSARDAQFSQKFAWKQGWTACVPGLQKHILQVFFDGIRVLSDFCNFVHASFRLLFALLSSVSWSENLSDDCRKLPNISSSFIYNIELSWRDYFFQYDEIHATPPPKTLSKENQTKVSNADYNSEVETETAYIMLGLVYNQTAYYMWHLCEKRPTMESLLQS